MKIHHVLFLLGTAAASLSTLALMARGRLGRRWSIGISALGVAMVAGRLAASWRDPVHWAHDLEIFWEAGRDAIAGRDPYASVPGELMPMINPPTAVPLFEAFASLPLPAALAAWKAFISVSALALVPVAFRALAAQSGGPDEDGPEPLKAGEVGCVAAALAASEAATADLQLGQLASFTALALTVAVWAQGRRRPILAGLCLAAATVKIGTMLPVLILLFHRRSDLRTWASLAVATAVLCLIPGHVAELPTRLGEMLGSIRALSAPGRVNDIRLTGLHTASIVGFEHAFYRLGLRDVRLASIAQFAALGALGAWLASVIWRRRVPRPAACALTMLYGFVFLYHRVYDAVVLALPLACAVSLARSTRGRRRLSAIGAAVAILAIISLHRRFMYRLTRWSIDEGLAGRLVQAAILPYATWAVLLAIACLYAASRRAGREDEHGSPELAGRRGPMHHPALHRPDPPIAGAGEILDRGWSGD